MLLACLRTQPETAPCQEGVWLHTTTASHHQDYADHAAASECASRHLAVAVQGSAAKGLGFQAALRHTTKAPVPFISWLQAGSPAMLDFKPQAGLQQQEHGRNQQARCWAYNLKLQSPERGSQLWQPRVRAANPCTQAPMVQALNSGSWTSSEDHQLTPLSRLLPLLARTTEQAEQLRKKKWELLMRAVVIGWILSGVPPAHQQRY